MEPWNVTTEKLRQLWGVYWGLPAKQRSELAAAIRRVTHSVQLLSANSVDVDVAGRAMRLYLGSAHTENTQGFQTLMRRAVKEVAQSVGMPEADVISHIKTLAQKSAPD